MARNIDDSYYAWIFETNKNYLRGFLLIIIVIYSLYLLLNISETPLKSYLSDLILIHSIGYCCLLTTLFISFSKRLSKYTIHIIPHTLFIINAYIGINYLYTYKSDMDYTSLFTGIVLSFTSFPISMTNIRTSKIYIILTALINLYLSFFIYHVHNHNYLFFVRISIFILSAAGFAFLVTIMIHKFAFKVFNYQCRMEKEKHDIFKEKEKFVDLNKTKNQIFSIISHDLRTPFNVLIGYFQILSESEEKQIQVNQEEIQKIYLSIRRTYNLITNLLTWGKSQQNSYIFSPSLTSMKEILEEDKDLFQDIAKHKHIKIIYGHVNNAMAYCDKEMITTVVRNLALNAIKYTKENGTISINCIQHDTNKIKIEVADTGIGMNKKTMLKITERKIQNSKAGTAQEDGSGIGLLICQDFLYQHSSKLKVESTIEQGSKFSFSLPTSTYPVTKNNSDFLNPVLKTNKLFM